MTSFILNINLIAFSINILKKQSQSTSNTNDNIVQVSYTMHNDRHCCILLVAVIPTNRRGRAVGVGSYWLVLFLSS